MEPVQSSMISRGYKLLFTIFGIVLVLAVGLIIYYFVQNTKSTKFDVLSEVEGIEIQKNNSFDKWFQTALQKLQIDSARGFFEYESKKVITPRNVKFVFRDISKLSSEEKNKLLDQIVGENGPLAGHASKSSIGQVEYSIYLDTNPSQFIGKEPNLQRNWSFHLLRALYNSNPSNSKTQDQFIAVDQELGDSMRLFPFDVQIKLNQSYFEKILNILTDLIIKPVYAQNPPSCRNSSYECGTWFSLYRCANGSQCLGPGAECSDFSQCTYVQQSCGAGGGGTWMRDCNSQGGTCSNPECTGIYCYNSSFSGSCVPFSNPTPTPTPQPTPTPPPGQQYCGNCNNFTCGLRDAAGCSAVGDSDGDGQCEGQCNQSPPPENNNVNGSHDGFGGNVPAWQCRAGGWAVDQDDLAEDIPVRILSEGIPVASGTAQGVRGDLQAAGVCTGGSCAFDINLWGIIPANTSRTITAQGRDGDTLEWENLGNTPKDIYCCSPLSATAPTISQPAAVLACGVSSANVVWGATTGATSYALRIDDTTAAGGWSNDCGVTQFTGDVCLDNYVGTSYPKSLIAGHTYNAWVHGRNDCGEWTAASPVRTFTVMNNITLSGSQNLQTGTSATFTAASNPTSATIGRVEFSTSNAAVATVCTPTSGPCVVANPALDTTSTYNANVAAVAAGAANITARSFASASGGTALCTSTAVPVTVAVAASPWWQVRGGDVTAQGDLNSLIPSGASPAIFNLQTPNFAF